MRITRLQFVLLVVAAGGLLVGLIAFLQRAQRVREEAAIRQAADTRTRAEMAKQVAKQESEKRLASARLAVAKAAETLAAERQAGRDVVQAEATLQKASAALTKGDAANAQALALRAETEARQGPFTMRTHRVRRGDTLWRIAKRSSGRGSDWYRIWLANRDTIPDFDVLRAGLSLKVPSENSGLTARKGM